MLPSLHVRIPSRLEEIDLIDRLTNTWLGLSGVAEEHADKIALAVREATVNAIQHGNRLDGELPVDLRCWSGATGALSFELRDRGEGFDIDSLPDPRSPENLLKPSGRGILLMRAFMDEVDFRSSEAGGTVVTMSRRIDAAAASEAD